MALYLGTERVKIRTAPYARYTVRNALTIQNGVASDFAEGTSANAKNLDIPSVYPLTANSKIHIEFTPTQRNFGSLLGKALSGYGYCIRYLSGNVGNSYLDIYDTTGRVVHQTFSNQATIVTGNRHTFDLEYNGTTYTVLIKDIDTNTTIVSGTLDYAQPSNSGTCGFCIGGTNSSNHWYVNLKASVNLNNSYIMADGQYVWRGDMQNVETWTPHIFSNDDYLIENGKLIQVNSNIYCQSTGEQYIDTGVYADNDTGFYIKVNSLDNSSDNSSDNIFIGSRNSSSTGDRCFIEQYNKRLYSAMPTPPDSNDRPNLSGIIGQSYTTSSKFLGSNTFTFNDETYYTTTQNVVTQTRTTFLFDANNGSFPYYPFAGKIYFVKISQGNQIIRHFVPVPQGLVIGSFTVPSNGMFDIVSQTFYGNAGSGNFTIGKDE